MLFDALIVDSDLCSRGYLWQATLAEPHFRRVTAVRALDDALLLLTEGYVFHVLLISHTLERNRINSFVQSAKQTSGGKEAAYVLVLRDSEQTTDNIAFSIMEGSDGFLILPFSVHSLREVAAIAARVKHQHELKKKRAAIQLIVMDLIQALESLAFAKLCHKGEKNCRLRFSKVTASLQKLKEEDLPLYFEVATDLFSTAAPRPLIDYHGISKRVRERLEEKILSKGLTFFNLEEALREEKH